jgi:hypothetical protein
MGGKEKLSKKCGVLTSYQIDNKNKCIRFIACEISQNTKNPMCLANGQK